jgi:hypothetical protein
MTIDAPAVLARRGRFSPFSGPSGPLLALAVALLGCRTPASPAATPPPLPPGFAAATPARPVAAPPAEGDAGQRVILVAIDGVRWQDVFEGVDPVLAKRAGMVDEEV